MNNAAKLQRLNKELTKLKEKPPWGVSCSTVQDDLLSNLEAEIMGPRGSPYEKGLFKVSVIIPEKYPFEPPQLKFITPIYHPNIDKGGRICMDMLKMKPKGGWLPTITLETLLVALQSLLANPNPDDPLMIDIANEYKHDNETFIETAKSHTDQYAS